MKKTKKVTIDCRSKEGVAIGLIDTFISVSRVLAPMLKEMDKDELPQQVLEALKDLVSDEDILCVLRMVHSRFILSEIRADAVDGFFKSLKDKKINI